jgi:hypothetical protein
MCPGRGRVWITSLGLFEVRGIVCVVCVCVMGEGEYIERDRYIE